MKSFIRKLLGMSTEKEKTMTELSFKHYKIFDTEGAGYFCEFEYPNNCQDTLEVKIDNVDLYPSTENPPGLFVFCRNKQGNENGLYIRFNENKIDIAIFSGSEGEMKPDGLSIKKFEIPTLDLSLNIKLSNVTRTHEFDNGGTGTEQRLVCEVVSGNECLYSQSSTLIVPLDFTNSAVKCVSSKGRIFHN